MSLIDARRRWGPIVTRIKARLASKREAMPPKLEAAVDEAVMACDSLLQDLSAAEIENRELRSRIAAHEHGGEYLFRVMPAACLVTDTLGTVVSANPRAADLLNMSTRHLPNRVLTYFMEDRDAFLGFLRELSLDAPNARTMVLLRPRERAPLEIDLLVVPHKPGDAELWLWFLIPTAAQALKLGARETPSLSTGN